MSTKYQNNVEQDILKIVCIKEANEFIKYHIFNKSYITLTSEEIIIKIFFLFYKINENT